MADPSTGPDSSTGTESGESLPVERPTSTAAEPGGRDATAETSTEDLPETVEPPAAEAADPTPTSADDTAVGVTGEVPVASGRRERARPRPLVVGLAALLVVLVGAGVSLIVHNHRLSSAAEDRTAALQAAQSVATTLTTITAENLAGQIETLDKQATGAFRDQLAGYSAIFRTLLKQGDVASAGSVTAAGIEKLEGDTADALITVAGRITSGQRPDGQTRIYRFAIQLQREGDRWLASNVDLLP